MSIRSTVAALALLAGVVTSRVCAQVRADPGTVINGRVAVRVYVTLSDEETSYVPIGGVNLRFFRTTADTTVVVRTDEAGAATALLSPGEYRLVSTSPVDWKGARYMWSQLVQVRAGLPTIELTAASAERVAIVADATAAAAAPRAALSAADDVDGSLERKDPSMATMLSFFVTGTGQMYAGEPVKGASLLALTAIGVGVAAKQLSCSTDSDCESTTGRRALGAAGMVAFFGSWLYGIFDAGDAARRFNAAHGLTTVARPIVAPDRGRTRLGFSVSFGR